MNATGVPGYMENSPFDVTYTCEKCGESYTCKEWEIIRVLDDYGFGFSGNATTQICLDCYEITFLWWEDYFEDKPEELRFIMDAGLHI